MGADVLVPPISDRWDAVLDGAAGGWWGQLMKAIRSYARGDLEAARLGYLRSDQLKSTPWAARGLALLASSRGDHSRAAELYARAIAQAPTCLPLLVEATRSAAGRGSTHRLPGDDRRRAEADFRARPAGPAAGTRPAGRRASRRGPRPALEAGIEVPDLREGRRSGRCGGRRSATGRCRTTTTSGCVPTSTVESLGKMTTAARLKERDGAARSLPELPSAID